MGNCNLFNKETEMSLAIKKVIDGDEFYLYMDGNLIYKRWLKTGESKVFDVMAYDKYTYTSIKDIKNEGVDIICIKARISVKSTEEGGRKTAFLSGYRPNHVFYHEKEGVWTESFIGDMVFSDTELMYPGEEREVTVRFLCYSAIEKYLNIGRKWYIYEANKLIAIGEILEFIK